MGIIELYPPEMQGTKASRIYLVGFMGSGKSTIAPLVAQKLKWQCIDLDIYVEQITNQSITELFALGEQALRKAEGQALSQLTNTQIVIATGGGTILREQNRRLMKATGMIVYLYVDLTTLKQRLSEKKAQEARPLLRGVPPEDFNRIVEQLYQERIPFYGMADRKIDTTGRSEPEVVDSIVNFYEESHGKKFGSRIS